MTRLSLPLLALLAPALLLCACPRASNNVRIEGDRAVRPGWIPKPNRSAPNVLYITGSCLDQQSKAGARACAMADAEKQIQRELGKPVQVRGAYVEEEHSELRRAASGEVRDYWVLVAFPRTELTRVAGRVLIGLRCTAEPAGSCDPRYPERIEAAMTALKMTPAPERLLPDVIALPGLQRALARAKKLRAARVMLTRLEARFLSSMDGEFYAEARCDYRLIDAVSGKVEQTFESGPVKGGHINKPAAVRKALDNCVAKLSAKLASAPRP